MSSKWSGIYGRVRGFSSIFYLTVFAPTIISIFYFGYFASDVYVSESRFVVRSPEKATTSAGLGLLLKSAGFANAGDEIYAAQDYVLSRDGLQAVNRHEAFRRAYGGSTVSRFDRFDPFGFDSSFEALYRYYRSKVRIDHDASSSITTLVVRAYSPQEARRINERLLEMAEMTVNRLNTRGRQDLIMFAEVEVQDAARQARQAAFELAAYRNREGVVDPEKQAGVQLQMIAKLQDELISTKSQLIQIRRVTPANPQIEVLEAKEAGLAREIDVQLGKVAGSNRSLSSTAARYQRLAVNNQIAERQLASAMTSLEDARNEARRKQAYLERIVQPNMPDEALEPRRLRGVVATFALGLVAWGVLSMLLAGVKEHWD